MRGQGGPKLRSLNPLSKATKSCGMCGDAGRGSKAYEQKHGWFRH